MIQIRSADIDADRELLVDRLHRYLTPRSDLKRYDWLYRDNPHGRAAAWIATDDANGEVVGSGAVIPRLVRSEGKLRLAPVMADFWVHPNYRSLGPAVQLQRACVEGIRQQAFGFFDLPQANMWVVYKRLKLLAQDRLVRFAKPLHASQHVRKKLDVPIVSSVLGAAATRVLGAHDWYRRAGAKTHVSRHSGEMGQEFTDLASEVADRYGVCVDRSADYLTWRYVRHYHLKHEVYCARSGARLRAYAIFVLHETDAQVVDLYGVDDVTIMRDLLLAVASELRSRGYATLSVAVLDGHPWGAELQRYGFSSRDAAPAVVHTFDASTPRWLLTYGDFDN